MKWIIAIASILCLASCGEDHGENKKGFGMSSCFCDKEYGIVRYTRNAGYGTSISCVKVK